MTTILENKQLMENLVEVETPEELTALFAQHSIELEEGLTAEEAFRLLKEQGSDELDENELENVNGGIGLGVALGAAGALVLGAAAIIFIGGYAYQKYQNSKKKKSKKK